MPELPEVETTRRGIAAHITGCKITKVMVRQPSLRWPVPEDIEHKVINHQILSVTRRAKYLLINMKPGSLIIHLGMSGSLRIADVTSTARKHDHVEWYLDSGKILRFNDPRKFGAVLWSQEDVMQHRLLSHLGPEPLDESFSGQILYEKSNGRKLPVKSFLMNNEVVVGVGNIYATEALFMANIRPDRAAGDITKQEYERLVISIKKVLFHAIKQGGTTLKNFTDSNGKPGYFAIELLAYGKKGKPCPVCGTLIESTKINQRTSTFCPHCQK